MHNVWYGRTLLIEERRPYFPKDYIAVYWCLACDAHGVGTVANDDLDVREKSPPYTERMRISAAHPSAANVQVLALKCM